MSSLLVLLLARLSPSSRRRKHRGISGAAVRVTRARFRSYGQPFRAELADIIYDPFVAAGARGGRRLAARALPDAALRRQRRVHGSEGRHVHRLPHVGDADLEHPQVRVGGRAARRALDGRRATGIRCPSGAAAVRAGVPRRARRMDFVYMPGAGGTVLEVDRATGAILRRLGLFGALSIRRSSSPARSRSTTTAPSTTTRCKLPAPQPWAGDHLGAWLVKITPDGVRLARFLHDARSRRARAATAQCTNEFPSAQLAVAAVAERRARRR